MLKWEITFHEKPQGLWRPKVSIRFWVEGEEWKILNINPVFKCKEVLDWLKYSSCSFCSSCLKQYPLPVYSSVFPSNTEAFCFLKSYIDLNCLPCQLDFFIEVRPAKN
ncbi:MAG: hypothetical protein N2513_10670, partial [Deltaproteobacteria bacterium]|nr:hypothetical protein [Deltaproteobacteria bacterium]